MLDPHHDVTAELRMYKKDHEMDDEDEDDSESNYPHKSSVHKLKLPSSLKKSNKSGSELAGADEKGERTAMKTRRSTMNSIKAERKDNKENIHNNSIKIRAETRGVKRKLKVFNVQNRQNDCLDTTNYTPGHL